MESESSAGYNYQVGGSLPLNAPTYVNRKADAELYEGVLARQFCYVLNSRQMGKSSLRVQTMKRLKHQGILCAAVDLTAIGGQGITLEQWYGGIAYTLASSLNLLDRIDVLAWWHQRNFLFPVQRLGAFIEVLLEELQQPIAIFIDEIDNVLRLDFPTDDFFTLIRSCYDRRGDKLEFQRLTWVLLGVATPSELMKNPQRTPFNIGRAIDLTGFQLEESEVLARGLIDNARDPRAVLEAILAWTGGKPFLTQKLCELVQTEAAFIREGEEEQWIEKLVRSCIIDSWETQDEPEHLRSIRDRLRHQGENTLRLLRLYKKLLDSAEIPADDHPEHKALRLSGLVVKARSQHLDRPVLKVYNRIYAEIFNASWVDEEIERILPVDIPPDSNSELDDEQLIYDHFIYWVRRESAEQLLQRFRQLFIEGMNYPDREIEAALYRIIAFFRHEQKFKYLLYRCCTIAINHWKMRPHQRTAIAELVGLLQHGSPKITTVSHVVKCLEELRHLFVQSEEFRKLQHLVCVVNPDPKPQDKMLLGQAIGRFPFLFSHCLLSDNNTPEFRQIIREEQAKRQRDFEVNLARYATSLVRQSRNGHSAPNLELANPTLLSDRQLYAALQQFVGKVDGSYTYRDLAQLFLSRIPRTKSYQAFKADLYEYLIAAVDPRYGKTSFYQSLDRQLKNTFPESDCQPLDEVLVMRTCSRLFNFLVDSPENPNYLLFIDLINNLGALKMIGLLLKIALLSRAVKPYLERRFSLLFNYYESADVNEIAWLVNTIENLNVALVTNFGDIDLSFVKNNMNP